MSTLLLPPLDGDDFDLPEVRGDRAELGEALGLSAAAMARARRAGQTSDQPMAVALSLLGMATEDAIAEACATLYSAPAWPTGEEIDPIEPVELSPRFLQDRYAVCMTDAGGWSVGLVDPGDKATVEALRFALGDPLGLRTLRLSDWRALQKTTSPSASESATPTQTSSWLDDAERLKDIARDAPVVRLSDQILERAFLLNASDVHVEQKADHSRVLFRIDGALREQERLGPELAPAMIARIKVLSDLDVAERRAPQDGRTTISVRGVPVDVRVSTTPTVFGESLVVRLLTRRNVDYALDRLGLRAPVVDGLKELLARPHGLILVTGPTGSGKTTTLYAGLRTLADGRRKILTIEDPVEYVFEDILQGQVNEAAGFTFASALRGFLRHDPDVILVGEIRDAETARLAVQASLTGHLVLATVHTNDAATTPSRLVDMGVERYLLADALIGVLAQRLVSALCPTCRGMTPLTDAERAALDATGRSEHPATVGRAMGCQACDGDGRRGRRVISELMRCGPDIRERLAEGVSGKTLRDHLANQGHVGLRDDAFAQAMVGEIDWSDAWRAADQ